MRIVSVSWHKDGDHLIVYQVPWWVKIYEWFVSQLFCPSCGVLSLWGLLTKRWGALEYGLYYVWSELLHFSFKKEKELFSILIPSGCAAEKAIFGKHDFCWRDDCEVVERTNT